MQNLRGIPLWAAFIGVAFLAMGGVGLLSGMSLLGTALGSGDRDGSPVQVAPGATPQPRNADARVLPQIDLVPVADGLTDPVHIANTGDGSNRLFVVEQAGLVRVIEQGTVLPTSFLDIVERVECCGERGLLSVAFPPDYATKGYFYVDYTRTPDGATVVSRFRVTDDPNVADAGSEEILLVIEQPYGNHNGGQLLFGPDGYLYVFTGDGGSGGDPENRAQNLTTLLGKILRIDVESTPPAGQTYGIPADNPFVGEPEARPEIWAYGLRNPWRNSFDRATGDLYIGDVGQNQFEEISLQPAASTGGENYGWRCKEAFAAFNTDGCGERPLVDPIVAYDHSQRDVSVTGGVVYRGERFPAMQGIYFYGDYVSGRMWGLRNPTDPQQRENVLLVDRRGSSAGTILISSFGEDEDGNLYLTDYANGRLFEVVDTRVSGSEQVFAPLLMVMR